MVFSSRDRFITEKGYEWASLTKNLDVLVYGAKAGPAKLSKAEKYGISVKSWEEFLASLEG